jgi:hypothetical protein
VFDKFLGEDYELRLAAVKFHAIWFIDLKLENLNYTLILIYLYNFNRMIEIKQVKHNYCTKSHYEDYCYFTHITNIVNDNMV